MAVEHLPHDVPRCPFCESPQEAALTHLDSPCCPGAECARITRDVAEIADRMIAWTDTQTPPDAAVVRLLGRKLKGALA